MSAKHPEDEFPAELDDLADDQLVALAAPLIARESELSAARTVLHSRIDILRAELVRRLRDRHADG